MTARAPAPPFSRPFVVAELGDEPEVLRLEATEVERAALARDTELPGIPSLVAELTLARQGAAAVHVTGRVKARATRECVVTLDPFEEKVDEEVDVTFAPAETRLPTTPRGSR